MSIVLRMERCKGTVITGISVKGAEEDQAGWKGSREAGVTDTERAQLVGLSALLSTPETQSSSRQMGYMGLVRMDIHGDVISND